MCTKLDRMIKDFSSIKLIILIRSLLGYLMIFAKAFEALQYLYAMSECSWATSNSYTN